MNKKFKSYILYLLIIFLCVCIYYMLIAREDGTKIDQGKLNISLYRVEDVINKYITNREILLSNEYILVGYNKKELENGYYDLKISINEKILNIHVNKMWKEYNGMLYEDEYIQQITNCVLSIFGIENETFYNHLYDYMVKGYLESKSVNNNSFNDAAELKLEEVKINKKIEKNELILSISKEVDK